MKPLDIISRLNNGELVSIRLSGYSMKPLIHSKQKITLSKPENTLKVGDIVFVKVKGKYYYHLLSDNKDDLYQISNNYNHVNGWVNRSKIFGIVIKIED